MTRLGFAIALLLLAGCENNAADDLDAAVSITDCDGGTCTHPADNHTPVVLRVCTPVKPPLTSAFDVTLRLSDGVWQNAPDAGQPNLITVSLAENGCQSPSFTPSNVPGIVRIDATVDGINRTDFVELVPATLLLVSVTPSMGYLPSPNDGGDAPTAITLTANVRAVDGVPSVGTTVQFAVENAVPDTSVVVFPTSAPIDSRANASAIVTASRATTQTTIRVTASATQAAMGNSVTQDVVLHTLPVR
jgi:hypothetical protein